MEYGLGKMTSTMDFGWLPGLSHAMQHVREIEQLYLRDQIMPF
jgi:hypothetical protein